MTSLSALIVAKNESIFIKGCLERILPYVDEVIFVDNSSSDNTLQEVEGLKSEKIKTFSYPETDNMGELRQFSLDQATSDWIWQVDADEWYVSEDCEKVIEAINKPGEAISFRVGYHQMSWRKGFEQANFVHFPDRLYRRDIVDKYDGLLPNDMTKVKKGFYTYRPFLEYDNPNDKSFENPKQPILPVFYYHLARTRGYNFEYKKWYRYNKINHKDWDETKIDTITRQNQWVSGLYDLKPIDVPFDIPSAPKKVSVIIPNFQYAKYVGNAIKSVQEQTYQPYEIIVVDDGSEDNSREIIDQYDVKKIYIRNGGVAHARNVGAMNATGDLLFFLDADDELAPTFLEKCVGKGEIVYTDMWMFGDVNFIVNQREPEEMKDWQVVPSMGGLMDRRIFEQVGGLDNGEWYEDWGFWLRCFDRGFQFTHIKKPLFRYRKHGKSRIDMLDKKQEYGFQQLRERYKIKR